MPLPASVKKENVVLNFVLINIAPVPLDLVDSGANKMAAIKHNLQRDVFKPSEERLYAVVSVTKVGKKKKASFLCVAGMNPTLFLPYYPVCLEPNCY